MAMIIFLVFSILLHGALGEIICNELPNEMCSFSVSSSGKRCLLETYVTMDDETVKFECKSSEVVVENLANWIETDECISSCGVDRHSVGISSDKLMEPHFTAKLCSSACSQKNCPNIVDLYNNLALAEGVVLADLCKVQQTMPRRAMSQLLSSGSAAGPVSAAQGPISAAQDSSASVACAPASI
ncbi:(+)-gamma-cadinene synthase [Heracleum sosnowskyi]|uniref:(+)-gamma-cadinene synthase n=1 Tax=Heracleum sosnowskyi TaxID=360622 RepID=A0AAD8MIU2_9APIA|nr:(+)-gamma-cadinene synthase [Heracleum sosnowskyi]